MGMFDSVYVPCPHCGKGVEFQSKAWHCCMSTYTIQNAPAAVLSDILNEPTHCEKCGGWMALIDPAYPPGEKPKPNLRAAKVRPPEAPETHSHGYKWWPDNRAFTYADLIDQPAPPAPESTS